MSKFSEIDLIIQESEQLIALLEASLASAFADGKQSEGEDLYDELLKEKVKVAVLKDTYGL